MDTTNQYGTCEIQKKLLDTMKSIHTLCIEKDIKYSLCGGSLLGAVREKGFIPWDDDMDIVMNRENYRKFIECFSMQSGLEIVEDIWVPRVVKKEDSSNSKAFVDIFIFDNVPENRILASTKVFCVKIIQGMLKGDVDYSKYSAFEKVLVFGTSILGKLFTFKFKKRLYSWFSQWANDEKTSYINAYNDLYKLLGLRYPSEIIKDYHLANFEDTKFFIMDGFDVYLKTQYGDYMTPPPVEERYPGHIQS